MGMGEDESPQMPQTTPRLYAPPQIRVVESCESVKTQAVKISNKVMELQFEQMAQFITNYLSQSKYMIQMSELKLTRNLRKDLYKYMSEFSNLSNKNINFGAMSNKMDVSEK